MSELSGLSTSMLLNILRMCTDVHIQRGFEPAYVRVVREAAEEALAIARTTPKPACEMPDALVHHNKRAEVCMWCWAEPEDMAGKECKHHIPCLACDSHRHSECMHDVS